MAPCTVLGASNVSTLYTFINRDDNVTSHDHDIKSSISNLSCCVIMPRRYLNYVVLPRFILLVAGAAAADASGPPGAVTTHCPPSSHEPLSLSRVETTNVAAPLYPGRSRPWGAVPRSWNSCRRPGIVQDTRQLSNTGCLVSGTADPTVASRSRQRGLSWARIRGGAGTQVDVDGSVIFSDSIDDQEEVETVGLAEDELGDADEDEVDGQGEESDVSFGADEEQDQDKHHDEDEEEVTEGAKPERREGEYSAGTEDNVAKDEAEAEAAITEGYAALKVGLGEVLPALMKSGAAFILGTWLNKKLSPSVPGQVRAARIVYTVYLVFSQALCMYLRWVVGNILVSDLF